MDGVVREGFLCPICLADLNTALNLDAHFKDEHASDQKLFKSFKGIYEKAKKKLRGSEVGQPLPEGENSAPITRRTPGYPASPPEATDSVACRSHFSRFSAIRDLRNERYAVQTNTLLIRLEKLLAHLPTDPVRRKAYEQEIVTWLDDKEVALCPGCAKAFGVLKRKHHCRLCGAIMCKNCTHLLPLERARKMVEALLPEGSELSATAKSPSPKLRLQPVQAVQSVLSLDSATDTHLRLCEYCFRFLNARQVARQNRSERPIILQFYERMRVAINECDHLVDIYLDIYSSLCAGKTAHDLTEAQELRFKISKLAETVDVISKQILVLGQNTDTPPQNMLLHLQKTIRNAATLYLKQRIITLPSLPSEEEIAEYQERRRLEFEKRIEEERKQLEEELEKSSTVNISAENLDIPRSNSGKVKIEGGWTPSIQQAIISDDPILQQIGILHGFIDQAQNAGKFEEVEVLRRNLMELEEMLDQRAMANV